LVAYACGASACALKWWVIAINASCCERLAATFTEPPKGSVIGYDREEDTKHYNMTESGIVAVGGKRIPMQLSTITI
jgi:hypothetical protein